MTSLNNLSKQDLNLLQSKYKNLDKIKTKIENGYPIQYLIGYVNFYGYLINVNKNVLIPRFETEYLVEKTINYIKKLKLDNSSLLDIGTGSGAIAIALKKEIPSLNVSALDISVKALNVAKKNAKNNKAFIDFIHKDLFKYDLINKYEVVICNPPYIDKEGCFDFSIMYEPSNAIFVNNSDSLIYYKKVFELFCNNMMKKHLLAFEIDEDHGDILMKLAKEFFPNDVIKIEKDLANKDRYLFIYKSE